MKLQEAGPDRLVGRSGGGCLAVFGLPFLAAGLAVFVLGRRGIFLDRAAILYVVTGAT